MNRSTDVEKRTKFEVLFMTSLAEQNNKKALSLLNSAVVRPYEKFREKSNFQGLSFLNYSILCNNSVIASKLLDMGADPNELDNERSYLTNRNNIMKEKKKFFVMERLPGLFGFNMPIFYTPLFMAVEKQSTSIIQNLIKKGADLNRGLYSSLLIGVQLKKYHFSPLISAIINGQENIALALLHAGACPYNGITSSKSHQQPFLCRSELTPLFAAAGFGMNKLVSALLKYEINPKTGGPLWQHKKPQDILNLHITPAQAQYKAMYDPSGEKNAIRTAIMCQGNLDTLNCWSKHFTLSQLSDDYFPDALQAEKPEITEALLKAGMKAELSKDIASMKRAQKTQGLSSFMNSSPIVHDEKQLDTFVTSLIDPFLKDAPPSENKHHRAYNSNKRKNPLSTRKKSAPKRKKVIAKKNKSTRKPSSRKKSKVLEI